MSRSNSTNKGSLLAAILSTFAALIMMISLYTVNKVWTDPDFSYVDGIITNGGTYQVSTLIVENILEKIPTAHLELLVNEGWSITLVKQPIDLDSSTVLDEFAQGGAIDLTNKKIYLISDLRTLPAMTGHELGHALDYACGNEENATLSDSQQFQDIYAQENENKSVISSEFFAEVYVENLRHIKRAAGKYPQASQYIQNVKGDSGI